MMNRLSTRLDGCALRCGLAVACAWLAVGAVVWGAAATAVRANEPCSTVHIPNPAPVTIDEFGFSVAISGDVAVVGAYKDNPGGVIDAGSAYVYRFDGSAWLLEQAIPNPELQFDSDQFGWSVAVSGDVAVVGANMDSTLGEPSHGSAYIYRYNGSAWLLEQAIPNPGTPNVNRAFDDFGQSVAISGDVVMVGAPDDDAGNDIVGGAVYVYRFNGSTWPLVQTISNPEPAVSDADFGGSVALSGDVAVIGARVYSSGGLFQAGSAYVYRFDGSAWLLEQAIPNPEPTVGDHYGWSVAVSGDVAVVGARLDDPGGVSAAGSAYVYRYNGSAWLLDQSIPNPDPESTNDHFGVSVAMSGDVVVVGAELGGGIGVTANTGSAFVYRYNGSAWLLDPAIRNPQPTAFDEFGISVAISGNVAVVGAYRDDPSGVGNAGSAYVFELQCAPVCCTGDFDGDNVVNNADIPDFVAALLAGGACPAPPACCPGDFNSDGLVNGSDQPGFLAKLFSGGACP